MDEQKHVILRCSVGCLRHVVGISYFHWKDWEEDEPEMYFETLHEPYEGFWKRLLRAYRFVVHREPIGVDSTLIGATEARKLAGACFDYIQQHEAWQKKYAHQPAKNS